VRSFWIKWFFLCLLGVCGACQGDGDNTSEVPGPVLHISPLSLDFGREQEEGVLSIENHGRGVLGWSLSWESSWITATPTHAQTTTKDAVRVRVDRTGLARGTYAGIITVRSDAGTREVPVTLEVAPVLEVGADHLDFGADATEHTLAIGNRGPVPLRWKLLWDQPWIAAVPDNGETVRQETVRVRVDRAGLAKGTYAGGITVDSDGGTAEVSVTLAVSPLLDVDAEVLDFGLGAQESVFHISNKGTGILEWRLAPQANWIAARPSHGHTGSDPTAVVVNIDRTKIPSGRATSGLSVESDGGNRVITVHAEELVGTRLYLGPDRTLSESDYPEGRLWIRGISREAQKWSDSLGKSTRIQRVQAVVSMAVQPTTEAMVSIRLLLVRNLREIPVGQSRIVVNSRYPSTYGADLSPSPGGQEASPGDTLVLEISSDGPGWIFLGGEREKKSYLILEEGSR